MRDLKPYKYFIEYSKFIPEEKYAARKFKYKKKQQSRSLIQIIDEIQKNDDERMDEMGDKELQENQVILSSLKEASLRSEERVEHLRRNIKQFRKNRVINRRELRTQGSVVLEEPNKSKINQQRISSGEYTICDTMLVQYFRKQNHIMIQDIHPITQVPYIDPSLSIYFFLVSKNPFPLFFLLSFSLLHKKSLYSLHKFIFDSNEYIRRSRNLRESEYFVMPDYAQQNYSSKHMLEQEEQPTRFQSYTPELENQASQNIQNSEHFGFERYPALHYKSLSSPEQNQNTQNNTSHNLQQQHSEPIPVYESPLSLPSINSKKQTAIYERQISPRSPKNYQMFAKHRLEHILSKNQSLSSHQRKKNENQIKSIKSFKKFNEPIIERDNNFKIRREKQLKELRSVPNDKSYSHTPSLLPPPNKYKNVKPRLMNHTQKILPSLPTLSEIAIPELQSSQVLNDYKIVSHVGKGGFSIVSSAINKKNLTKYAIKTYTKINQMDNHKIINIQSEVRNLFALKHENIIDLKHAVKDGKKIQLIMQNGGKQSLSGVLRKVKNFDEELARKYFRQIVSAIGFCHENNICHRDLKLENILVDDNGKIKIIDFGFSAKCRSDTKLTMICGTPPYMSPQLVAKMPYNGLSSDIWALGVTLYLMVVGKFPFRAGNQQELYRLIQQGKFKIMETMSPSLRDLLAMMLKVDEKSRAKASDIQNSEWMREL